MSPPIPVFHSLTRCCHCFARLIVLALLLASVGGVCHAQNYRFTLRAEPDVIAANGISTSSIFVQVPREEGAISAAPLVRFATTAGVIESQAQLSGGIARVLLRSANTPGTATITAFIGSSREAITVEFADSDVVAERYLEIAAPYVAYGSQAGVITASGKTILDFGDTHIESDTRLDADLYSERVWAQGNVTIRQGRGDKAKQLRGERLFYDLRKRQGVIRRSENSPDGGARQEFIGSKFEPPPDNLQSSVVPRVRPNPANAPAASPNFPNAPTDPDSLFLPSPPVTAPEAAEREGAPGLIAPLGGDNGEDEPNPLAPENGEANPAEVRLPTEKEKPETPRILGGDDAEFPRQTGLQLKTVASGETRASALVTIPRPEDAGENTSPVSPPPFAPLSTDSGVTPRIVELPPPEFNVNSGYWITSRRLRVFPRDKIQFERASVFFNGGRAFKAPLYVLPLNGGFNPTIDLFSLTSQGGVRLKVPYYYQASRGGTGAIFLRNEPGNGFSTQRSGLSLSLDQQYYLSSRQNGRLWIDQIGNGPFDLNFQHQFQLDPATNGQFYLNMPRHKDIFVRTSVAKDFRQMQIGLEGFYDRPEGLQDNQRAQFFARLRPRAIGKTGWNYTVGANLLAVRRVTTAFTSTETSEGGTRGGGIGLPGGGLQTLTTTTTRTRPLIGQTLTANLQSPTYSPWRGSSLNANVFTTAFNYSDSRRGLSPGLNLSFGQTLGRNADLRFDYTYDRSALGLYGDSANSFTHYLSGSLGAAITPRIGFSVFGSKGLNDGSLYGNADLDYSLGRKWRVGLFTDYTSFVESGDSWNYGWSLARSLGQREVSINYDAIRGRVYFELGSLRY